jgi:hypothetical protein
LRRLQTRGRDNHARGPERLAIGFAGRRSGGIATLELFLWLEDK